MAEQQQTQTLSLRISEALRNRLEQIRELTSRRKGESVSTSEVAKQLLESAREDRLEEDGWPTQRGFRCVGSASTRSATAR